MTIFQFAENLPDRQASVLIEVRTRLVNGGVELLLLDILLERFREIGSLKARGK